MLALRFWGVDWERAIAELEALYASAPDYRDVFQRLYDARWNTGIFWRKPGRCVRREAAYTQALLMVSSAQVEEKRAQAAQVCLIATPVPQEGARLFSQVLN